MLYQLLRLCSVKWSQARCIVHDWRGEGSDGSGPFYSNTSTFHWKAWQTHWRCDTGTSVSRILQFSFASPVVTYHGPWDVR